MYQKKFMEVAITEAKTGIQNGHGGPFGAAIVKDDTVIASGHNCVIKNTDSTCHGEIDAIRKAEQALGTYDLSGCQIYTTAEPCPMCLAAIIWANIDRVYYGCTLEDNSAIGFRDEAFDQLDGIREREILSDFLTCTDRDACLKLFDLYSRMEHIIY